MADDNRSPMDTSGAAELNVDLTGEPRRPPPPSAQTNPAFKTEVKDDDTEIIPNSDDDGNDLEVAELNINQDMPRTVSKPFVYGSVSRALARAQPNGPTHSWTVYLRPRYNEDMSLYVRRVEFRVHSIPLIRVCTEPPYELSQVTGWGEFEVKIKLFFVDKSLRPVTLAHTVKLLKVEDPQVASLPRNPLMAISGNVGQPPGYEDPLKTLSPGKPIVAEYYDELVFVNPTETLHSNLIRAWECTRTDWQPPKLDWDEQQLHQLDAIRSARTLVQQEIDKLKHKMKNMKELFNILEQEVKRLNLEMNVNDEEVDIQMVVDVSACPGARTIAPVDTKPKALMKMASDGD